MTSPTEAQPPGKEPEDHAHQAPSSHQAHPQTDPQTATEPKKRKRLSGRAVVATMLLLAIVGVIGAELAARFVLGLGDPPLLQTDADTEYLAAPGEYNRFGNRVYINEHHQRAEDITPTKAQDDEYRVLILGDSVTHGGSLTDQADVASTLLEPMLERGLDRPARVMNASAGSWGVPNILAYVQRFGAFEADVAVVVLNTEDIDDLPSGGGPPGPTSKPALALMEGATRYLPRYMPGGTEEAATPNDASGAFDEQAAQEVERAIADLARALRDRGVPRLLAIVHRTRPELSTPSTRADRLAAALQTAGFELIDTEAAFAADPDRMYRDHIHPSVLGQRALAGRMARVITGNTRGPMPVLPQEDD